VEHDHAVAVAAVADGLEALLVCAQRHGGAVPADLDEAIAAQRTALAAVQRFAGTTATADPPARENR
jgi:hypothetical protein